MSSVLLVSRSALHKGNDRGIGSHRAIVQRGRRVGPQMASTVSFLGSRTCSA